MAANSFDGRVNRSSVAVLLGVIVVTFLAVHRIANFPYTLSWTEAWRGIRPVLPVTGPAALKVWGFWGWSALVIGGLLLKADPALGLCDSALAGATGAWACAFWLGNLLGPIGLLPTILFWALPAIGTLWLWRYPPAITIGPPTVGQRFAFLALALLAVSILPLQLGSPMVPYLDALSWPASAQRIVSFQVYQPFNNDPYGFWAPFSQEPALELFYAALALGSRMRLAVVAETAAMLPMCALLIFSVYRVGRTLFDDCVGGMAALLLFLTPLFGYAQGMRGTALDFVLVGVGLGFFLDPRPGRVHMAVGALLIGTSIATQAPIGAFATVMAGGGLLLWLAAADTSSFAAGGLCLLGAVLFGAPEIPIGLNRPLPYPILPLVQIAGVVLILFGASHLNEESVQRTKLARPFGLILISALTVAVLLAIVLLKPIDADAWNDPVQSSIQLLSDKPLDSVLATYRLLAGDLPLLTLVALGGLFLLLRRTWNGVGTAAGAALLGFALLLCVPVRLLQVLLAGHMTSVQDVMLWNLSHKLSTYWCPYFLALLAALPFAAVYNSRYKPVAIFAILSFILYPWHLATIGRSIWNDDREHSVVERWAFNLDTAANGYYARFAGAPWYPDGRWASSPAQWALFDVFNEERRAGRITTDTRILHVSDGLKDFIRQAVFTGITDEPIDYSHDANNPFYWGGRIGGAAALANRLAEKPPYILFQVPPRGIDLPPPGYDEIFHQGDLRLFRRRDLNDIATRR